MDNNYVKLGQAIICWLHITADSRRTQPVMTFVTEAPKQNENNEWGCEVNGHGWLPFSQVDPISPGSLLAAKLGGMTEISNEDINRETRKFFEDRGINVVMQ